MTEQPKGGQYILETCEPGTPFSSPSPLGLIPFLSHCILAGWQGDLVLIHGSVLHKSERNTSGNTRFAYTFHMIDSAPYCRYDEKNWLQPTAAMPFSRILDVPNTAACGVEIGL